MMHCLCKLVEHDAEAVDVGSEVGAMLCSFIIGICVVKYVVVRRPLSVHAQGRGPRKSICLVSNKAGFVSSQLVKTRIEYNVPKFQPLMQDTHVMHTGYAKYFALFTWNSTHQSIAI